jgi:hypothetical protein
MHKRFGGRLPAALIAPPAAVPAVVLNACAWAQPACRPARASSPRPHLQTGLVERLKYGVRVGRGDARKRAHQRICGCGALAAVKDARAQGLALGQRGRQGVQGAVVWGRVGAAVGSARPRQAVRAALWQQQDAGLPCWAANRYQVWVWSLKVREHGEGG